MANAPGAETELAADTTNFDNADSSTDNDSQDTGVANDSDLEDDTTGFDDVDDDGTDETDSEDDDSAAADDVDEEDSEDLEEDEAADTTSKAKKDQADKDAAEAERKRQNDLSAQRRIQETTVKREQAKQAAGVDYVTAGAQDAYDRTIERGGTPEEAQGAANSETAVRQLQVDAYNNKVQTNLNTLTTQAERAKTEVPELTKGTPAQQAFLSRALDEFEAMYVTIDRNGDPVEVRGDLVKYLQAKRADMLALSGDGATKQNKDKKNQRSRVMNAPGRPPAKKKADAQLDAFDEEAARP